MISIEKTEIVGLEHAMRGMRNPKNSWDKSDSGYHLLNEQDAELGYPPLYEYQVGEKDKSLAVDTLAKGGPVHAKYRRMIGVYADITCNHVWWQEFDTYKVGTVRDSCSKMHKIQVKEFVADDFSHEGIDEVGGQTQLHFANTIIELERLRKFFNETGEKKYWRALLELLPMGFNLKATVYMNYEVLTNIYTWRKKHKWQEWVDFCKWIETLPYSEIITKYPLLIQQVPVE